MVFAVSADNSKRSGFLSRSLRLLVRNVARHPRLSLWIILLASCGSVGIAVSELTFEAGRDSLAQGDSDGDASWAKYTSAFGKHADLVVLVETEEPNAAAIQTAVSAIGTRLEREPELFTDVLFRIDQRKVRRKGLQYLTVREIQKAERQVEAFAPVFETKQWDQIRLEQLTGRLRQQIQNTGEPAAAEILYQQAERVAMSLQSFLEQIGNDAGYESISFQSPWTEIVTADVDALAEDADVAYLMNHRRNAGMLQVTAAGSDEAQDSMQRAVVRLREITAEVVEEQQEITPGLSASVTGIPVLEHDELSESRVDMVHAAIVAFLAVGLVLTMGFRNVRHPMLLLLMMVVALSLTFGVATLAIGHLNMLSICFAAVLVGLGVDFGIHFISRYVHVRQDLLDLHDSLETTAESVGPGILTSAFTTALAFGSAALTPFPGLAELGIIAAAGILIAAMTTFLVLPALIALSDAELDVDELPQPLRTGVFQWITGYPRIAIGFAAIIVAGFALQGFEFDDGSLQCKVQYDSNLIHLHDPDLSSVQAEEKLFDLVGESLLYAVAVADSREEAIALRNRFLELPSVSHVKDLASKLPDAPSPQKQQLIQRLQARLAAFPAAVPAFAKSDPRRVGVQLDSLYRVLRNSPSQSAHNAAESLNQFLDDLVPLSGRKQAAVIDAYQNLMTSALLGEFAQVTQATDTSAISAVDLPTAWRNRYLQVSDSQELWALRIYPKAQVWDDESLATFVREIQTVSSDVTGIPVRNHHASVQFRNSFQLVALYALGIISLLLLRDFLRPGHKILTLIPPMLVVGFIGYSMHQRSGETNVHLLVILYLGMVAFVAMVLDFRNLRDTGLALLPALGGAVILCGVMSMTQVHLNPVNLVVLPLVLGIGVDDGIHLIHDYRRQIAEGANSYVPSGDAINGVLLTSLTSMAGFSSLMIAGHRGLSSVGVVMSIGVAGSLFVATIMLPSLLALVAQHQPACMDPVRFRKNRTADDDASSNDDEPANRRPQGQQMSRKEMRRANAA